MSHQIVRKLNAEYASEHALENTELQLQQEHEQVSHNICQRKQQFVLRQQVGQRTQ
jgi:hypothetical protein